MLRTLTSFALLVTASAALAEAPHWGYGRQHGPGEWAHLDPAFATCAEGTLQSPIDIRATRKAPLPKLEFLYRATPLQLVNNGHTVQVNAPPGSILTVDGKVHELLQLHFHTPSEEAIRGKRYPLVAHLVHRGTDGTLAVVAVLFDAGKPSRGLAQIFGRLPGEPGETRSFQKASVNPAALLPRKLGYYAFEGSLTTPPCTEGVQWYVLKEPVKLSRKQLAAFRKLFKENARPVQPLNGRVVRESA